MPDATMPRRLALSTPRRWLICTEPDQRLKSGESPAGHGRDGLSPFQGSLMAEPKRPRWCWKHQPEPDPSDRLRRSEGCRAGYPTSPGCDHRIHPMSGHPTRRHAAQSLKNELLEQQGYVCVYCAEPFGSVVRKRNGGYTVTSVHFDHAIPLAYLNANPRWNWVAACNVCNMIKGAKMFRTIAEIRMHILGIRDARNQHVAWLAPVSCEEDPEKWAAAFSSYLAGFGVFEREIEDVPFDIRPPKPKAKPRGKQKKVKGPWPWSK